MSRLVLLPHVEVDAAALRRQLAASDVLVPLTVEGIIKTEGLGARSLPLRELVPYEEICSVARRAHELVAALGRPPSGPAVFDGVDWNRLLLEDGSLFYARELLFGQALGRALAARDSSEVVWVGRARYEPHLPLHGLAAGLMHELPSHPTFWPRPAARPPGLLPRLGARARRLARRVGRQLSPPPPALEPCRIAATFATSEWRRFTEPLAALHRALGNDLELWYLGPLTDEVRTWAAGAGVTARSIAYPTAVHPDVEGFAAARWHAWRERDRDHLAERFGCPALASEEVAKHFSRLFTYTLPRTVQWARTLAAELGRRRPSLLLGSSAFNYLTAFPYLVAAARGLPSLALAHTCVPGDHTPLAATYLGCRSAFERESFRRSFPADERTVLARDAANSLSYDASLSPPETTGGKLVAVLTSSPSTEGLVLPMVDIDELLANLRELAAPPRDLNELHLAFKFHPRYDLSPLVPDLFTGPGVSLFPSRAPVTRLLAGSWAVVVCNHYGSVVAEAVATGKPLIFLDSARFFYPGVETSAFAAGQVVRSPGELWSALRGLAASPGRYRQLAERCGAFRDRFLASPEVSIVDALASLALEPVSVAS